MRAGRWPPARSPASLMPTWSSPLAGRSQLKPGRTWDLQHGQEVWSLGGGGTLPVCSGALGRMEKGGRKESETIVWDKTGKQGEIYLLFTVCHHHHIITIMKIPVKMIY